MTIDKTLQTIIELDQKHYLNCFGTRPPLCIERGEGVWLYGTDGRRYLDLIGGIAVNVLGHNHPRLVRAIADQAAKVIHCSNYYYNSPQTLLAARLAKLTGLDRVFFSNSGAEANEAAIKLARGYFYKQGRPRQQIVTALQSSRTNTGNRCRHRATPIQPTFRAVAAGLFPRAVQRSKPFAKPSVTQPALSCWNRSRVKAVCTPPTSNTFNWPERCVTKPALG